MSTPGLPAPDEAPEYYFRYIGRITAPDIVATLESQLESTLAVLHKVDEDRSKQAYAPGKWTLRQLMGHVSDCERLFAFRALWFARALPTPLPSFEPDISMAHADSDTVSWSGHLEEFRVLRQATLALFGHLPAEAWTRRGIADGNTFSVRAMAYIAAGHVDSHLAVVKEKYLGR